MEDVSEELIAIDEIYGPGGSISFPTFDVQEGELEGDDEAQEQSAARDVRDDDDEDLEREDVEIDDRGAEP